MDTITATDDSHVDLLLDLFEQIDDTLDDVLDFTRWECGDAEFERLQVADYGYVIAPVAGASSLTCWHRLPSA
jgi:hypothetical protein